MTNARTADIAVIGLGAMGAAALWALTRRGVRAIGIERFAPGHDRGSSHGATRIIRQGYFEHPSYVPLVQAAYPFWRELEADNGLPLLTVTGIIEIGPPDGRLVAGTLQASREHHLSYEVLDAAEIMLRFPAFRPPAHHVGVWQPDGGFLHAEACVEAFIQSATRRGATTMTDTTVNAIEPHRGGVTVHTSTDTIEAERVIVAAGAWTTQLLRSVALPLQPTRQVLAWFAPSRGELFTPERFPVFLAENETGLFYGFPVIDAFGLKVAKHHHRDETAEPDTYDRTVSAGDVALVRSVLASHLPSGDGPLRHAMTCLYTMTPDEDFIIDRMPGDPRIVVASPCSGHGFKFAPVIGDILADLAITGRTPHDISRFRMDRFGA